MRATGEEDFDTMSSGEGVIEYPEPGEVVWRDDGGVTCRRWNWRQCRRTALTDETQSVYIVLDLLEPVSDDEANAAVDALLEALAPLGEDVRSARRLIGRD